MPSSQPYRSRLTRARRLMETKGIGLLALFPGVNMAYMTGFREEPGERLLLCLIPGAGEPLFIVPRLYEEHVVQTTWVEDLRSWNDGEDPAHLLGRALRDLGARRADIAVDSRLWARFFLMFLRAAPLAKYRDASEIMEELRVVKEPKEVEAMRRGFRATDAVMAAAIEAVGPGRTEAEVATVITREFLSRGAERPSFDPIVGSGPNGALPHHRAGERRMRKGDGVVLDLGGLFGGYCTDMTRTVFVGKPTVAQGRVYGIVACANEAGFAAVRPGVEAQAVDRAARSVIEDEGLGPYFTHRTGHGIGLEVHEEPYIVAGNRRRLEAGMTFSVEPGVYLPGKFGVRIEDIVLARARPQRLDRHPRKLQVV